MEKGIQTYRLYADRSLFMLTLTDFMKSNVTNKSRNSASSSRKPFVGKKSNSLDDDEEAEAAGADFL